jgi:hypothetical protein
MTRFLCWLTGAGGLGLVLLTGVALGADGPKGPPGALPGVADRGKGGIEAPTKQLVAGRSATVPAADQPFVNPKVQPGKVRWHADLAEACKAAGQSGKPVLLFQMMGRLDEKFC